jgi:hypothetical protein
MKEVKTMSKTTAPKITKKTQLNALIALIAAAQIAGVDGDFDFEGLTAYCTNEIGLLDKKAAKAKENAAAKKAEKDELCLAVESVLTGEFQTRQDVADQIEGEDVTVAKVGYRLTKLVELGVAEKSEVSVPGAEGKARKVVAYRLATATDAE